MHGNFHWFFPTYIIDVLIAPYGLLLFKSVSKFLNIFLLLFLPLTKTGAKIRLQHSKGESLQRQV